MTMTMIFVDGYDDIKQHDTFAQTMELMNMFVATIMPKIVVMIVIVI